MCLELCYKRNRNILPNIDDMNNINDNINDDNNNDDDVNVNVSSNFQEFNKVVNLQTVKETCSDIILEKIKPSFDITQSTLYKRRSEKYNQNSDTKPIKVKNTIIYKNVML